MPCSSFPGESYGWEAQFLHDGELAYGRTYITKEDALEEAEAQRQWLLTEGWTHVTGTNDGPLT